MNLSLLIAAGDDRIMSATEETALDTLEESETSPNEESTDAAPAHTKQASRLQVTLPSANTADTGGDTSDINTALAEGSDKATGELRSKKARKAPQPKSNERERIAPTQLDHTQSLQAGRSNTGSFAQRECDELRSKLSAAKHENSLLHKKGKLIKERKLEVTDHLNTVQEQKESLEATLFEKEEEYKQLLKKFELAESQVKQYAIDQKSSHFLEQIEDLTDENKRFLNQKNEFQKRYNACNTKLERKCEEALDFREQSKRYLCERNELQQQVVKLKADCDDLTLNNANLNRQHHDAVEGQLMAEESERKFRDAGRTWKNKYDRAIQAKNDEIQKGTKLAEEISTLRQGHAIQDDHSLRDDMATFRYTVRDWCDRILECKPAGVHAHFSGFPLDNEGTAYLANSEEYELNVLIASVWEWLIKLVFGYEKGRRDNMSYPDLWLENDKRVCLNKLEQYLRSKDPAIAIQWRYRTVQQLVDANLCTGDQRFDEAATEIIKWITSCLQLTSPTQQLETLKLEFEKDVLREAVDFALKLRRQTSELKLIIPMSISRGMKSIAIAKTLRAPNSEQHMLKVCIGPQIKKVVPQSSTREAYEGVIFEAEFAEVLIQLQPLEELCSCNETQEEEDIEVD